jgi:2-methylcitrate dehydratase PrpD
MSVGQDIARYIWEVGFDDFPPDVVERAKLCIIDSIGVALYGTKLEAAKILISFAGDIGGKKESTVLGSGLKVHASLAALANGISTHVADYDDSSFMMLGHPSAVTMPTVLAVCEALDTTGKNLLSAFIVGNEVGGKLGKVMNWSHYEAGWHGTGTIGTIAAAAAAAKALNLSREEITQTLAIAASGAGGLRENFGTMTKSFHAGQAARNGIIAAQLAKKGFTASPGIFEASSGFFKTFSGTGDPGSLPKELGEPYALGNIMIKKYPSCAGTHPAVDAILDLREKVSFQPEEVDAIDCKVQPITTSILMHPDPQDELEAKFSMQFCVSAALVAGQLRIAEFNSAFIKSPQVQRMVKRVRMIPDQGLQQLSSEKDLLAPTELTLRLVNGKQYVRMVEEARGGPASPLTPDEVALKFMECASLLLPPSQSKAALELLKNLESLEKISQLLSALDFTKNSNRK